MDNVNLMKKVSTLTPQQEVTLPKYKQKWQSIALSTTPIDRQTSTRTIEAIYRKVSKVDEFDIYFFDSPACIANISFLETVYPADNWRNPKKLSNLIRRVRSQLLRQFIGEDFYRQTVFSLIEIVGTQIDIELWHYLEQELRFWSPLNGLISANLADQETASPIWQSAKSSQQEQLRALWMPIASGLVTPDSKCSTCCVLDFCISELHCVPDEQLWQLLTAFVNDLGWTFFFQDFCLACDRPHTIFVDDQNRPHSTHGAAVQFSDGFNIFADHGESIGRGESNSSIEH
jgi:hypothetical protein